MLDRLSALPDALFVRGNADRYLITGDLPDPTFDQVRTDPDLIPLLAEVVGSFNWTLGNLVGRGWYDWLSALPLEQRCTLPDGTRALLVHCSPTNEEGNGLNPTRTDAEYRAELGHCEADLICVGNFHLPMDRRLDGVRVINPGPVSNNFAPDLRARYSILTADERGYEVEFFRVAYDIEAAIKAVERARDPGAPYQIRFLRGEIRASWAARWDGVSFKPTYTE